MCCGFWEIKVFSLLQKLEEEILTFRVDGVLGSDAWKCCPNSAATHKEGHCGGGGHCEPNIDTVESREEREKPRI